MCLHTKYRVFHGKLERSSKTGISPLYARKTVWKTLVQTGEIILQAGKD